MAPISQSYKILGEGIANLLKHMREACADRSQQAMIQILLQQNSFL